MSVTKDGSTGRWMSQIRVTDWTGKVIHKKKRGFATKKEALKWEQEITQQASGSVGMTFGSFVEIYYNAHSYPPMPPIHSPPGSRQKVNPVPHAHVHLLTTLIKCPLCGAGMYGNKSTTRRKDGTPYDPSYYYACKHRRMERGHKCDYKKQIPEKVIDQAVAEVIINLVRNPRFASLMQEKIDMKVDTSALEQEIATHEKQLRQYHTTKSKLIDEIDSLDPDDKHYIPRKADLDERLYRMYDKMEETETLLIDARAKKRAIEADKVQGDNIYRILTHFDKLYDVMSESERQELMQSLIAEIHIHEQPQPNGQWLKSIKFRLPIIDGDSSIILDKCDSVETVILLSR